MKGINFIDYLDNFTDDVGVFQHSVCGIPDARKGYTTDDNSRGLILAVMILESFSLWRNILMTTRWIII